MQTVPEHTEREWLEGLRYEDKYPDPEPLGTCVIHGDYWTDDCVRCAADQGAASLASPRKDPDHG